jgi:pyruvate ferredoxin oxidoreductase gamma subunit
VNEEGYPEIDYEHCKGCMICVAQCPTHAISAIAEDTIAPEQRTRGGVAA